MLNDNVPPIPTVASTTAPVPEPPDGPTLTVIESESNAVIERF